MSMQVKDIMKTDVKTIEPDDTVQEAARRMNENGIGSLIVTDKDSLRGIVTDRDILVKVVINADDASKVLVKDVMTKDVVLINPDISVEDASEVMIEKNIKKLPVVEDDSLIGIVTATDIVASQPKLMEQLSRLLLIPGKRKKIAG